LTANPEASRTIRFAPEEEKTDAENKTEETDEENNYQNEEDGYEEDKEEDDNFVLPPFFEE